MRLTPFRYSRGFTLIELMIGITISLFLLAGVTSVYVLLAGSARDAITFSRLNEETLGMINLIGGDVRRAGYWRMTADDNYFCNPFTDAYDSGALHDIQVSSYNGTAGACLTYSYDRNKNGVPDIGTSSEMEQFGVRFNAASGAIEMRTGGTNDGASGCSDGTWARVNRQMLVIDALSFDLSVEDFDLSDDGAEFRQYREMRIVLGAHLRHDPDVFQALERTVELRNDRLVHGDADTLCATEEAST